MPEITSNAVLVRAHSRHRPSKPDKYRTLHNRLYDEVQFLESLRLQDELAEELEAELERM